MYVENDWMQPSADELIAQCVMPDRNPAAEAHTGGCHASATGTMRPLEGPLLVAERYQ